MKACKDVTSHHVEEEEQDLLPAVDEGLEDKENQALGKQMKERFEELTASGYEKIMAERKAKHSEKAVRKNASHAPRHAS